MYAVCWTAFRSGVSFFPPSSRSVAKEIPGEHSLESLLGNIELRTRRTKHTIDGRHGISENPNLNSTTTSETALFGDVWVPFLLSQKRNNNGWAHSCFVRNPATYKDWSRTWEQTTSGKEESRAGSPVDQRQMRSKQNNDGTAVYYFLYNSFDYHHWSSLIIIYPLSKLCTWNTIEPWRCRWKEAKQQRKKHERTEGDEWTEM